MGKNLNDFNKSKEIMDEKTPYNYEEYCRNFKVEKKPDNRNLKLFLIIITGVLVAVIFTCFSISTSNDSTKFDDKLVFRDKEEKKYILKEVSDKGIDLQLNDIKINEDIFTAKMTLDYSKIDKNLIDNKEKKLEILTKGYFNIFIGDSNLKTFSPSMESTFYEDKTEMVVKVELPREKIANSPIRIDYVCDNVEIIYSATKSSNINGNWGFSYTIEKLSDVEQGKVIEIEKFSSLCSNNLNIELDVQHIVFKNGNVDLVYRYENKGEKKLSDKYNLELKIFNSLGIEISTISNMFNGEDKEKINRISPLNLDENIDKIRIIPRITEKTLFSKRKLIVEGTPIDVHIKNSELIE